MEPWTLFTLAAASFQTLRFAAQKVLKGAGLSTAGATFARFAFSAPLVPLLLVAYGQASAQALPVPPAAFWPWAMAGGAAQILATMAVVALFSLRNFAVGITLKKTEVLMSAAIGWLLLGDGLSRAGLGAMVVGLGGVLMLSDPPQAKGRGWARVFNRSAGLGLASGVMFGMSGVGYRGAALTLGSGDAVLRALVVLTAVTLSQLVAMALWLAWRERGEITRVLRAWRVAGLVGAASLCGSFCWFTAFTLQKVGYVNALGQVELILSVAVTALFFGEKISAREWQGLALLSGSILALVLVA